MKKYDVTFIGHMCYDEIIPYGGEAKIAPGSAVLCGAMAAIRTGKKIAAIVRMNPEEKKILQPMEDAGIDVYIVPSEETTYSKVIHPSPNVDERELVLVRDAGYFSYGELPDFESKFIHLAGISDQEFNLEFIKDLNEKSGASLSSDMQSFVRQVNLESREISFSDVADKQEIVSLLDKVKLDIVEAEILTGTTDLSKAAKIIAGWGTKEVIITQSDGVLALADGDEYYEKFSNKSIVGRTGRGDTTFASYLCRRIDHDPLQSLKFAAALVSLKMEKPGPFSGTIDDVLQRMKECH